MSYTILIVDDNHLVLRALCEHLEKNGYETMVATNGQEAIKVVEQQKPDLIIMDIIMPVMNGIEATRILRNDERFKKLPIIAFTSHSQREGWGEYFDDYLLKPFHFDTVLKLIERFLPKPLSSSKP